MKIKSIFEQARDNQHIPIKFIMNLMFCLPGESLSDAIKSIRFASSLKPYGVRPCILKVYKGTELAKYATVHGYSEGVGNLTIKTKDTHHDFSKIANMLMLGM